MTVLTTGTGSGFGKHVHEAFGGSAWTRQTTTAQQNEIRRRGTDVIVHCAVNSGRTIDSECLAGYLDDNVLLTERLVSMPHTKFVYISSSDVYPKDAVVCSESAVLDANAVTGVYALTKLMSEAIVRRHCSNYLILRCVTLLGIHARRNNLIRLLEDEPCQLTLTGDSRQNYILHSDVSDFIRFAIDRDIRGIFNVSSSESVLLSEVADMIGKRVQFGTHHYDVGPMANSKIAPLFAVFRKTSREIVREFIGQRAERSALCC